MSRFRRLAVWLVPLLVGLASFVLPGRAQQGTSSRYAFADTLLLRDTLGLDFKRLFPTADSLGLAPDTLRAWMIRWKLPIPRMLALADSLGYPVDSVGPVMDRERFNVFAASRRKAPVTTFEYSTSYDVRQTQNTWTNASVFSYSRGNTVTQNRLNMTLTRLTTAGKLTLNQTRQTQPQFDWSISKGHSLGLAADLSRALDYVNGIGTTNGLTRNQFNVTGRSKTTPLKSLTSDLNLYSGILREDNNGALKRALTGEIRTRFRYVMKSLTHDVNTRLTANRALTRARGGQLDQNTNDLSHDINGTLTMLQNSPLGLVSNYRLSRSRVQTPTSDTTINSVVNANNSIDATLKGRIDNERYLQVTGTLGHRLQSNGDRTDKTGSAVMRWTLLGWGIDASYRDNRGLANYPRNGAVGGYDEHSVTRASEATATRQLGRVVTKVNASIGLDRWRYADHVAGASHSADHDNFRQSYRVEGRYAGERGLSNTLALEVGLTSLINIPGSATSTNNDLRRYAAEWRWSYQLFEALTANQTNTIAAEYRVYPFAPTRNDLSLDYNTVTILSAQLSPRLRMQVTHNFRQQPKGSYQLQPDGLYYLLPSDEGRNYTLSSSVDYALSSAFSLSVSPNYAEINRFGNQNGVYVPQRRSRSLNIYGSAHVNKPIGKGLLTGDIGRRLQSDRSISYTGGVASVTPRSEQSFWSGTLTFTWNL